MTNRIACVECIVFGLKVQRPTSPFVKVVLIVFISLIVLILRPFLSSASQKLRKDRSLGRADTNFSCINDEKMDDHSS
jgi:hypothetical protein